MKAETKKAIFGFLTMVVAVVLAIYLDRKWQEKRAKKLAESEAEQIEG